VSAITLTVFFEDPFWVGVVELRDGEALQAARHVFGAEPAPPEVLEFVLRDLGRLLDQPSVAVAATPAPPRLASPKRAAREAARQMAQRGIPTQAHEALRLELEQRKVERRQRGKAQREAEAAYKREIKVQKAKAKHRGR
jgi:hypothetical protein